jgi:aminocarboxymuconate-semialdehyde decarboxylase
MMKGFENRVEARQIVRRDFLKFGASAGAMMALNARRTSAQSRAGKPGSIDVHNHWTPERYIKVMAELGQEAQGGSNPLNFDLDKRRKWMDEHGVQMHVLTLSGGMPWQWVPPDVGATLAQIVNDAAIEAHTAFPDRFLAAVEMSIRDPKLALKELNRVAGKPGLRAVHLPNSIEGRDYLFEPAYEPLLTRCEELGYPLLFHPLDGDVNYYSRARLGDPQSLKANLINTLGFPFDHATAAAKFITSGTLDRHLKLEIVLPHAGGVFPYIAGRMDHGFAVQGDFKLPHPFAPYIRRFHYDTLAYYPEALRFLIDKVGSDRVVIGTDNYAIMDVEYPNALVEQLKLPAADHDRILRGNAMRLLHL